MLNYLRLLVFLLMLTAQQGFAQHTHCGTSEKMQEQLELNPELRTKRAEIESFTERWITEHEHEIVDRAVVTIPVVVHVVYKTSVQNISDAQIQSQIDVLNEDYRKLNADVSGVPTIWTNRVADCEIQFALATCDPNGYWTNGITRTETTVTNWQGSDDVKVTAAGGHDPWPAANYLNIWVCNIGAGLLGYAYQPGINPLLDGVVIGYGYFGRPSSSTTYNKGRTATHEIGHYFNLDHLWGPVADNSNCTADDGVSDTPKQKGPNYDACELTYPSASCGSGSNSDMFNNFMDYGDDPCIFFFTNGQKSRMLAAINGPRASLLSSNALNQCPVGIEEHVLESSLIVYPNPAADVLNIQSDQKDGLLTDASVFDLSGKLVLTASKLRLGYAAVPLDVSELKTGSYVLELRSENEVVTRRINIAK
ncbi:MAG: T9SS type A sorting domain-containing protein [Flavobacteriales bacterium]|nr:T9SS type A sorting domain-containing protein [Flavobacteriales bacterium]